MKPNVKMIAVISLLTVSGGIGLVRTFEKEVTALPDGGFDGINIDAIAQWKPSNKRYIFSSQENLDPALEVERVDGGFFIVTVKSPTVRVQREDGGSL